jgi:hypothetical protein
MEDNFWIVTDALHGCNVVENHCDETTCEDTYLRTHFPAIPGSVFKEN